MTAALLDSVTSGDPYLSFAKRAGLAPADATKASHKAIRDVCKTCLLGANYGMQPGASPTGPVSARSKRRRSCAGWPRAYPVYTEWAQQVVDAGQLGGRLTTVFGWQLHVGPKARPTSLRNFPMQANGAEMLRLACCLSYCPPSDRSTLLLFVVPPVANVSHHPERTLRLFHNHIAIELALRTSLRTARSTASRAIACCHHSRPALPPVFTYVWRSTCRDQQSS